MGSALRGRSSTAPSSGLGAPVTTSVARDGELGQRQRAKDVQRDVDGVATATDDHPPHAMLPGLVTELAGQAEARALGRGTVREYGAAVSSDGQPASDEDISALVARLSRPNRNGGRVIERAAIMAEGANSAAILDWLVASSWQPEEPVVSKADRGGSGLHGMRQESERGRAREQAPRRYVSPSGDGT
jgi:hypothetical protein